MPRIKQTKMRLGLDPAKPWKETLIYVNYDNQGVGRWNDEPSGGRFYTILPQVMADSLGKTEVRAETQAGAVKAFEEALEQFKNIKTESNRVILYDIEVEPHPQEQKSRYSSSVGFKVKIWAGTYIETVAIAGNEDRRYSYETAESSISFPGEEYAVNSRRRDSGKFEHQVPWTKRNEAFFLWIGEQMTELIDKLAEIESPDKLIESISAGRLLPLGQRPQENK